MLMTVFMPAIIFIRVIIFMLVIVVVRSVFARLSFVFVLVPGILDDAIARGLSDLFSVDA